MKIVLSSNCATGGLAAALALLMPQHLIVPIPHAGTPVLTLRDTLLDSDYWLISDPECLRDAQLPEHSGLLTVSFPELYFDAFHPDQVYAWLPDGSLAESASGPYHSAVVLWAWRHELSIAETRSLFRDEVFHALGYHDRWGVSVTRLTQLFEDFEGFTHNDFLLPLIRQGAFMHTVNHPKLSAICALARLLASSIERADDDYVRPIEDVLLDSLFQASFSWPVYPSVADSLGIKGSFLWKLEDHSVIGLDDFIESSFARYATQDLSVIDCHQLRWPSYDLMLPNLLSGAS